MDSENLVTRSRGKLDLSSRLGSTWAFVASSALVLGIGLGCNKETQAAAEGSGETVAQAAPVELSAAAAKPNTATAKPRVSEANFDLELRPVGSYAAGKPGQVEVALVAKGPFKVNEKYPYKFKLEPAPGVKFESDVVRKEAVKLEKKKALMQVKFTPETQGKKRVAGRFSFSVCTDDKCLIEKRDLALNIDVK